jgi:hypothetical protein
MLFVILCAAIYVVYLRVQFGEGARYNWNNQASLKPSWYVISGFVLILVQITATIQLQGIRHLQRASPTYAEILPTRTSDVTIPTTS